MNLTSIEEFFLLCAGGDKNLLDKDKIPIEYNKLVGIGATVFLTSIYAFVAMSYTMTWLTDNKVVVLTLGLFWGAAIFNIDRLIVSTTYKKTFVSNSDLVQLIVRIFLTLVIALTISVPLEIKLFEPELKGIIKETRIENLPSNPELIKIRDLQNEYHSNYLKEINDGLGGRPKTTGKVSREWERKEEEQRRLYESKFAELAEIENAKAFGFISMYDALQLYKKNDNIRKISMAITLLLLLFELTPVLVKFTTQRGNYDERMESLIIQGRIRNQTELESFVLSNPLQNTEMPQTHFDEKNLTQKKNKNIINFLVDYVKGKAFDIALAVAMGLVLALLNTDNKLLPTIGAVITYLINQYLLPKVNNE